MRSNYELISNNLPPPVLSNNTNPDLTDCVDPINCSEGTRRRNCLKNIELDKYAFTTTQLTTFPRLYRPPVGTYGSKQT